MLVSLNDDRLGGNVSCKDLTQSVLDCRSSMYNGPNEAIHYLLQESRELCFRKFRLFLAIACSFAWFTLILADPPISV